MKKTTANLMMPKAGDANHGFKIVDKRIEDYIFGLHKREDETVLNEMESLAREENFPIVERLVGKMLEVLTLAVGAKRVFEFGSGYGYSAYFFARAVGKEGQVICTEGSEDNVRLAEKFLSEAKLWERISYHCGWAQDIFKKTAGDFDIIYNDVDKDAYPEVWQLAKGRLRRGGLYVCDNTLWAGRVTMGQIANDPYPGWTEAIQEHNQMIAGDPDFDFFLNPVRDGVIVARRR